MFSMVVMDGPQIDHRPYSEQTVSKVLAPPGKLHFQPFRMTHLWKDGTQGGFQGTLEYPLPRPLPTCSPARLLGLAVAVDAA